MKQATFIKLLAGLVSSGFVITAIQSLPDPWNKVAGGLITAIAAFVNWAQHKDDDPKLGG